MTVWILSVKDDDGDDKIVGVWSREPSVDEQNAKLVAQDWAEELHPGDEEDLGWWKMPFTLGGQLYHCELEVSLTEHDVEK